MGQFKDLLPSQTGWIHELAKGEIHPEAEKLLNLAGSLDPQQRVEESTVEFLSECRQFFTEYARLFNGYAEGGQTFQEVKVYTLAQTPADFMVFRNQVKLVFANTAHGVIQISFARHQRTPLAMVDGQMPGLDLGQPHDLLAQLGPFRDVTWTFQGEKIDPEQVAKFFFAEFIRSSRDVRRSRTGNQLLIEQIKTLLQDKGIDL